MHKIPCVTCEHWSRGCSVPLPASLVRHHGEPGDDSGTVDGWRGLSGLEPTPEGLPSVDCDPATLPRCPGHRKTPGRRQ